MAGGTTTRKNYLDAQFPVTQRSWVIDPIIGIPPVVINDLDDATDFTESANGTFDKADDTGDVRTGGTNSLKLTNTAATDGSQYVQTRYIHGSALAPTYDPGSELHYDDWSDTDYIFMWGRAGGSNHYDGTGELQLALLYLDADGVEQVGTKLNVPAATVSVHQRLEVDISSYGDYRKKITGLRFYSNNSTTSENVLLEAMERAKYSNGKGPVLGPCVELPIASGQTVARGNIVQLNPAQRQGITVQVEAAADPATFGVCVVGGTGNAAGTVYGTFQTGGPLYLRAAAAGAKGEGYKWAASHTVTPVTSAANDETNAFCKGLEVPGGANDDFLCELVRNSSFAS